MNFEGKVHADPDNELFWQKIHQSLGETLKLLEYIAEEQGVDFDHLPSSGANDDLSDPGKEKLQEHALALGAKQYGDQVETWFDQNELIFKRAQNWMDQNFQLGIRGEETREVADQVGDAIEVIRWYQHQIYIKLKRALSGMDEWPNLPDTEDQSFHSDGQAKVALIAMDDSLAAWGKLQALLPELSDQILQVMILLEKLRRNTGKRFPQARDFLRPGFDE
jgi:hypothetical protein